MLEVKFYDTVDDSLLKFAVIISLSNGKWVFCKHKERDTYEAPGGHREVGEDILETAKRELQEETGAIRLDNFLYVFYSLFRCQLYATVRLLFYLQILFNQFRLNQWISPVLWQLIHKFNLLHLTFQLTRKFRYFCKT
jgi:8-oxo-dGTP pyrophosphatase MutT (NUDIX family)